MSGHRKRFSELLRQTARNYSRAAVFNDFLVMLATAIANRYRQDEAYAREKRYLETVGKYKREDVIQFVEMAAELTLALEDCIGQKVLRIMAPTPEEIGFSVEFPLKGTRPQFGDVLGDIYREFELYERNNGQVFTPTQAADWMAQLTIDAEFARAEIERCGFVAIKEPCCGSGAITLGGLNALLELGINPQRQCVVLATDVDESCVLMSYIQLSLYGIPAVVQQKNAATGEAITAPWFTPMFVRNGWLGRYTNRDTGGLF